MIMKRILIVLSALTLFSCSNPEIAEVQGKKVIIIRSKYSQKKVLNFEMKKTKGLKGSGIMRSDFDLYNVKLTIDKSPNNLYQCSWKVSPITSLPEDPTRQILFRLLTGTEFKFTLDSIGVFKELINWQEIRNKCSQELENVIGYLKKNQQLDSMTIHNFKTQISEMFSTKDLFQNNSAIMADIQSVFFMNGKSFTKMDTINETQQGIHPVTFIPLDKKVKTVYYKAYSDSICSIKIIQSMSYLPETSMIQKDENNKLSELPFTLDILTDYNISSVTGLLSSIMTEQTVKIGEMTQIDKTEIKLK
jgi:hypothetical protein